MVIYIVCLSVILREPRYTTANNNYITYLLTYLEYLLKYNTQYIRIIGIIYSAAHAKRGV